MNYYNDNDQKACAWLRELIVHGHLPPGTVDERSILEIKPDDLAGFDQCHFFAGIGGWPLALRWAGLESVAGIWTGSCPCQPLSCAGQRKGHADERHLWPAFHDLIAECRPATVFGEQVASADGREWLAGVRLDLEDLGYACGGADLCAAGVGAPHRRQRLFWVADAGHADLRRGAGCGEAEGWRPQREVAGCRTAHCMADAECREEHKEQPRPAANEGRWPADVSGGRGASGGLGDATGRGYGECGDAAQPGRCGHADRPGWARCDILPCRDGKARRVEAGTFPLAHGIPGRMGLLRGYGNAIVPQVAEVFVRAWVECSANNAVRVK